MKIGKFIVLEGLDGCGKTTIINRLKIERPEYVFTREPGGSPFGEKIRAALVHPESANVPPKPFLLGFMSSRCSNFEEVIIPAVRSGKTVISDRFDASTYAFQLYGQQNHSLEDLFWYIREEIIRTEEGRFERPNYIYLRLTPEAAASRRHERKNVAGGANHFDLQTSEYHTRVFKGYEAFFGEIENLSSQTISPSENPVVVVDASSTPDAVYDQVLCAIEKLVSLPAVS
jgi:dTMP kinase